jgi:small-conductance mechanosensitive channel
LVDDRATVTSEVRVALSKRLAEEGIDIPFPQREVRLKDAIPAAPARS